MLQTAAHRSFFAVRRFMHTPACGYIGRLENFIATLHIGGSMNVTLERVSNRAVDHVMEVLCH